MKKEYRNDLDLIKGFSIIAVIIYHMSLNPSGYLGVDAFFVINGFLIIPYMIKEISNNNFHYFSFIFKRFWRLFPLLVIVCLFSICLGLPAMIPDDYLTLNESVVASLLFNNNHLSLFLCADYWDWTNDFKPLMHTWYLAILMEFYILTPLIFIISKKIQVTLFKKSSYEAVFTKICFLIIMISLVLFFSPIMTPEAKFYTFPARLFEFISGGLVGFYSQKKSFSVLKEKLSEKIRVCIYLISVVLLISILFMGLFKESINNTIFLPLTVLLTLINIVLGEALSITNKVLLSSICFCGKISYSLFLWHQVLLAFYRYFLGRNTTLAFVIVFFLLLLLFSIPSYLFIEKKNIIGTMAKKISWCALAALITLVSLFIWFKGGILYDVPELNTYVQSSSKRMNPQYVDRIYNYSGHFPKDSSKINVLVIGNSFARDFSNILLESSLKEDICLRYSFSIPAENDQRLSDSDYIFIFTTNDKSDLPEYIFNAPSEKLYCIGTKSWGDYIGQYYVKRYTKDYYSQTAVLDESYEKALARQKSEWGDDYIDLMNCIRNDDGTIRLFTDDNVFISYDCHHLSQSGAKYYAKILDLNKYVYSCK